MKWLNICAHLLLTLAALRAVSWALAWALARFSPLGPRGIAVLSNGDGLVLGALEDKETRPGPQPASRC